MFKPIRSLIFEPSINRKSGTIGALRVRQAAKEVIERHLNDFPEDILKQVQIKTFKNGVLGITAPPVISGELHMASFEILKNINFKLKSQVVKKIYFKAV